MKTYLLFALLFASSAVNAIIIRDDIEDDEYRISSSVLPALVDFPGEGHGVLISPQWIVTVAHVACMQHFEEVIINNEPRKVEFMIVHPGYKTPDNELIKDALATGNGASLQEFIASIDDIALIKLATPVTDIKSISLYRGDDEAGKIVQLIGKGSTGRGDVGPKANSPHRTTLRRAFNKISIAKDRWISYVFDAPKTAVELEGMAGKGDSGSAVLIKEDQEWKLAGIVAWESSQRDLRTYYGGRYGDIGHNVRMSYYSDWIQSTISFGVLEKNMTKGY